MDEKMLFPMQQQITAARRELSECSAYSGKFGLTLSETEITELIAGREEALRASGRIEFGGGILPKLIRAFCGSPFIEQENYAAVLADLQEAFYYFKTEAHDRLSDDELIELMVKIFNGRAQGSVEYLTGVSPETLVRCAKGGFDPHGEKAGDLF